METLAVILITAGISTMIGAGIGYYNGVKDEQLRNKYKGGYTLDNRYQQ